MAKNPDLDKNDLVQQMSALREAGFEGGALISMLAILGSIDPLTTRGALNTLKYRQGEEGNGTNYEMVPGSELPYDEDNFHRDERSGIVITRTGDREPRFLAREMRPLSPEELAKYPGDPRDRYILRRKEH